MSAENQPDNRTRLKPYNDVQLFFLLRLDRLLIVRREHTTSANSTDWWAKLLSKAIYSTYVDCIELNVGDDAKTLFARDKIAVENSNSQQKTG